MSREAKRPNYHSDTEVESQDFQLHARLRTVRLVDGIRVSLTALALLTGLTILITSGDAVAVYNETHVSQDFHLPLWPNDFNLRPTVAMVVGSTIVVVSAIVSLVASKVKMLRDRSMIHTSLSLATSVVGFTAATIAMIFFYAVNASTTVDTLQSWSCRWENVLMYQKPHWETLCRESKTGLYLSIILIPIEAATLVVAGYQMILEKKAGGIYLSRKGGSPMLS